MGKKGGCHRCEGYVERTYDRAESGGHYVIYRCVNCGYREDDYMKMRRQLLERGQLVLQTIMEEEA